MKENDSVVDDSDECEFDKYSIDNYKGSVSKQYDKIYRTASEMNKKYDLKFEHKCQYKGCNNIPQISEQLLKGDMYICPKHRREIAQSIVASVTINDDDYECEYKSKNNSDIKFEDIKDPMLKQIYNLLANMSDSELLQSSNNCGLPKDYFEEYYAKITCRMYDIAEILNSNQLSLKSSKYIESKLKLEYVELQQSCNLLFTIKNTSNPFLLAILGVCIGSCVAVGVGASLACKKGARSRAEHARIVKKLQQKIGQNKELKEECEIKLRSTRATIKTVKKEIQTLNSNYNFQEMKKNLQSQQNNIKYYSSQKIKINKVLKRLRENIEKETKKSADISQEIEQFKKTCDDEASKTSEDLENEETRKKLCDELEQIEKKQKTRQESKKQQLETLDKLQKKKNDETKQFKKNKSIHDEKKQERQKLTEKQKQSEKKQHKLKKEKQLIENEIDFDQAVLKAKKACYESNRPCIFIVYDTRNWSEYCTSVFINRERNASLMSISSDRNVHHDSDRSNINDWNVCVNKTCCKYGHYGIFKFVTDIPKAKYKLSKIEIKSLLKDGNSTQKVCRYLNQQIKGTVFCVFKIEKSKTDCWKKSEKNNFYLYHTSKSFAWTIYIVTGKNKFDFS